MGDRTKLLPYTNFYIEVLTQFRIRLLHVEVLTNFRIKLLHVEVLTIFPYKTSTLINLIINHSPPHPCEKGENRAKQEEGCVKYQILYIVKYYEILSWEG